MSYPDCSSIVLKTAGGSYHFREANPGLPSENGVSTSSLSVDDAVCWTGGTTAAPRDSYAIWKELREGARGCKTFLLQADLRNCNIFYNRDLYRGLLDWNLFLTDAPVQDLYHPMGILPLDGQA